MKNKVLTLFILTLALTIKAHATVGGDVLLADFKYSPEDESIYFTQANNGGRGCLPELWKLSLNTGKTSDVYSCDQAEKLVVPEDSSSNPSGNSSRSVMVRNIIAEYTSDFKPLTPLNLKKNNIEADVNFVRAESYGPGVDEIVRRFFKVSIYQNKVKVGEFDVTGCNLEQPFIFQGYAIPGYNKRIAILVSAKGDCFEGGYTYENLYSVSGLDKLDKTWGSSDGSAGGSDGGSGNFYKGLWPLVPNEGNVVVYEADAVGVKNEAKTDGLSNQQNQQVETLTPKNSRLVTVTIAILCLIIGLVVGKLLRKKSK